VTSGQAAEAPRLVRDVLLFDGSTLRLRSPVADDLEDIAAFYDGLSNESRFMRFHGYGRTDIAARALTEAGGVDRLALIARHGGRVVASAQYDLLREPGVAEVAFAVADDFQRRGTATRMLEQLASIAAERRLHRFDAEVLAANQAMLTVFERAGFDIRRQGAFGELTVSLDITPTDSVRDLIDERDHLAAVASVRPILSPGSVAVVGASSAPGDLGGEVLASILRGGFRGVAMPVNRTGEVVHSTRCALSLMELAETPELVILAVAPEELAEAASQAVAKGAKALLVLSADFSEDETEVTERQEELLEIVRAGGLRLLGPSSLGVINTDPEVRLNATSAGPGVAAGRLAVCSHSGAIGIGLLAHAAARRIGICSYVSLGERVDVSTNDLLELWEEDDRAGAVMLYVETFGNPEHFARIAGRVSRRKPILAVKGRRAAEAVRHEAQTHTAAALRGDAVVDALFHQAGVLRFRSGDELFNAARFFESQPLPFGRRIAIVSNSTGVATLAADACATRGLVVSDAASQCANPVRLGIGAGAEEYVAAVRAALADPGVDALMVYYVARYGGEPAKILAAISDVALGWRKPVVTSIVATDGTLPEGSASSVPNFLFPESCASVLGRAAERREWLSRPLGEHPRFDDLDADAARAQIEACLERDGGWGALNEGRRCWRPTESRSNHQCGVQEWIKQWRRRSRPADRSP
jgi:acetate---CoA ligase (ADP-forming)